MDWKITPDPTDDRVPDGRSVPDPDSPPRDDARGPEMQAPGDDGAPDAEQAGGGERDASDVIAGPIGDARLKSPDEIAAEDGGADLSQLPKD